MELDINTLMSWNLGQLYNYIKTIADDLDEDENKLLEQVEVGSSIPVHINYYIKEYYEEFPNSGKVRISGLGKISIEQFWSDMEQRSTIIRRIIINHLEEDDITEGRL